uniref:Uncharacterized protein n=1 Tax=Arion vulgaris TaxID=1028688 RepID=A0A0B7AHA3_9EUPU
MPRDTDKKENTSLKIQSEPLYPTTTLEFIAGEREEEDPDDLIQNRIREKKKIHKCYLLRQEIACVLL